MKLEGYKERDKKKIGVIIFTVCCVLLIAFVYFYNSFALFEVSETKNIVEGTIVDPGDLYFAYYVDNQISHSVPKKGEGYVFDAEKSTCTKGATPEFDDNLWAVKVNNMTSKNTRCDIYFKSEATS